MHLVVVCSGQGTAAPSVGCRICLGCVNSMNELPPQLKSVVPERSFVPRFGHAIGKFRPPGPPFKTSSGLLHGDLGIFLLGGQTEEFVHYLRNNRHTGDAPSNQPKVAGVFPQRNVGLDVNLSLSLLHLCHHCPNCPNCEIIARIENSYELS